MPEVKKYKVDGIDCRFKELMLDEAEEVNVFWEGLKAESPEHLTIKTSNDAVEKLFSMILEPCKPLEEGKKINFRRVTEPTALDILKDFFLSRVAIGRQLQSHFPGSMRQQKMP